MKGKRPSRMQAVPTSARTARNRSNQSAAKPQNTSCAHEKATKQAVGQPEHHATTRDASKQRKRKAGSSGDPRLDQTSE